MLDSFSMEIRREDILKPMIWSGILHEITMEDWNILT